MSTPTWSPATLYEPGSLVKPLTPLPAGAVVIPNAGFEAGTLTGWTVPGGAVISTYRFAGSYALQFNGTAGIVRCESTTKAPVSPGTSVTASCMYHQGAASSGKNAGCVVLVWYTASDIQIGEPSLGSLIGSSSGSGGWKKSTVTATAPAGAAKVAIGCRVNRNDGAGSNVDSFAWNLTATGDTGLVYRAVQPSVGLSAGVEPVWPTTQGVQVIDNEVIWEAVYATRIEWTAHPLLVSGATEPTWPTEREGSVLDNTIAWTAVTQTVSDPNCPHSRQVTILASKVFAGDDDITRYCATLNARDWTTPEDAGFLPTGMQGANCNGVAVLNQYRGNLAFFNPEVFQNWIADPDPAAMAKIDLIPGIGSSYQTAAQPVADNLYMLTARGVRSVSIAASAENLTAGDVGEVIDPLVRELIDTIEGPGYNVCSAFYPGRGQYLLAFAKNPEGGGEGGGGEPLPEDEEHTTVVVFTIRGRKGTWSRYTYPFYIDSFAQLGDRLYMHVRKNTVAGIVEMTDGQHVDDVPIEGVDGSPLWYPESPIGRVAWAFLDNGTAGFTKELEAFDYVGEGQGPLISIAYNQRNPAHITTPYQLPEDTLPGMPFAMPVSAPTMSPILDFTGGQPWRVMSLEMYFFDSGGEP